MEQGAYLPEFQIRVKASSIWHLAVLSLIFYALLFFRSTVVIADMAIHEISNDLQFIMFSQLLRQSNSSSIHTYIQNIATCTSVALLPHARLWLFINPLSPISLSIVQLRWLMWADACFAAIAITIHLHVFVRLISRY